MGRFQAGSPAYTVAFIVLIMLTNQVIKTIVCHLDWKTIKKKWGSSKKNGSGSRESLVLFYSALSERRQEYVYHATQNYQLKF